MVYCSYLHLNIWLKPIINWVFENATKWNLGPKFCLGLFTEFPISTQTKAIVPKAVIWRSVWSEFASLCELRIRTNLVFIQRGKMLGWWQKRLTTRITEEVSRNDTEKDLCSDNYSFSVKKLWFFFLSILSTLFQNHCLSEKNGLKNLSGIMKNEHCIDERRHKGSPFSTCNTKRKVRGLCHFTLSTNYRVKSGRNDTSLPYESHS